MSWIKRAALPALMVSISCALGILTVEGIWRLVGKDRTVSNGYLLFEQAGGGEVFRNFDGFFTYLPNQMVRSTVFYHTDKGWVREYADSFKTNNFGLKQSADIVLGSPSLLLLGDSFTEGQGAPPWFEGFAANLSDRRYQPINGGIMGTGFRQWLLLHDYLTARGVAVKKMAVIFISNDGFRSTWNLGPETLRCIDDYRNCKGSELFFGMPPERDLPSFLETMLKGRSGDGVATERRKPKPAFPALVQVWRFVAEKLVPYKKTAAELANDEAILRFASISGENVIFVHLPQKEELTRGILPEGLRIREEISRDGGRLYDGFTKCGLVLTDYHVNDAHPNEDGYAKISRCVADALRQLK
jgi:lysophospholipase L1-like esterase